MDLAAHDAVALAARMRRGEFGAVECLEHFRVRVEGFNPSLNAIVDTVWQRALRTARERDRACAAGEACGPLHGVPMTIKASFDLAGRRTTWGDPALRNFIAPSDDVVVERLERAGAVVFGKTNVPLRLLDFQSFNALDGVTANPWDAARTPGGSSGGSAAALAAGLSALELGSDLGGSIRQPAHCCGVFGHRPTLDVVEVSRLGAPDATRSTGMAVAGPMARSARDLAVAMEVLSGGALAAARRRTLREHRVALWWKAPGFDVDHDVLDRCVYLEEQLQRLGVPVVHASPDVDHRRAFEVYRSLLDATINPFTDVTAVERRALEAERLVLQQRWSGFMKAHDVVIAPVSPVVAFPHDHRPVGQRSIRVNGHDALYETLLAWPCMASLVGVPSTVFPIGCSTGGLPVGVQAMGAQGRDLDVIAFVQQVTEALGGWVPPPGFGLDAES